MTPLTAKELEKQFGFQPRYAVGMLPDDLKWMVRWVLRGPLVTTPFLPSFLRRILLRLGGMTIGASVYGLRRGDFECPNITVGDGTGINNEARFLGEGHIDIGANCMIAGQVMLIASTHHISAEGEVSRMSEPADIRIGDRVWLGARVTVMPGVTIGDGVIVGTGAVVTKDCEPGGVYGGVPARRIR